MLAAGLPVATGQFGIAQTEGVRKRKRRKRRKKRQESQRYCPTEEKEGEKQMKWRNGREGSEMMKRWRDSRR